MIRSPLWTLIVLSLLSFAAGFTTRYLFFEGSKLAQQSTSVAVEELKKDAVTNDIAYQKQVDDLSKQNIELQYQLQLSQGLLDEAKDSAKCTELKIRKLVGRRRAQKQRDGLLTSLLAGQSSERDKQKVKTGFVSLFDDTPCDSLINEVEYYINENHRKDSIYEIQLAGLDSIISVKDKMIASDNQAYSNLKALFQKSTQGQSSLAIENKNVKKQLTGQKVKSKVLTAAFFVLSGFSANYVLRH